MSLSRRTGTSAMFTAAMKGNIELFDAAIRSGENIESTNRHGQSVVHVVCYYCHFGLLEHLVSRYPEVLPLARRLDYGGYNAAHRCCRTTNIGEQIRTLDLLLQTAGIDVETSCEGTTLLDLARQYNFTDVEAYLLWRRSHTEGLPENIRRLPNDGVMTFLNQQKPQLPPQDPSPTTPPAPHAVEFPYVKVNSYLENFTGQKEKYRHIRVMFVGKKGAGKTTLCLRLQGKPVDVVTEHKEGDSLYLQVFEIDMDTKTWIRIDDVSSDDVVTARLDRLMKSQQAAFLTMWNMGGQPSFQASHGVFMSSHCVYILAFDVMEYLTTHDECGRITEWIRTIGTYRSSYDNSRPVHKPPIIIVGTKMDLVEKHIPAKNNRKKRMESIKEALCQTKEVEEGSESENCADFVRFCTVDNTDKNPSSYDEIRDLILDAAKFQDQWERELPVSWLILERDLLKQRTLGKKILTLEEIYEIDVRSECPILNKENILLFLEYLHRNRTIIFFRGHNQIVLDPQWMADAFRLLFTDKLDIEKDLTLRRQWRNYQSFAKLTLFLTEGLWPPDQPEEFCEHMDILLVVLEILGLIVRPIIGFDCRGNVIFANHYFVPSMLGDPTHTTRIEEELQSATFVSKTLCIMFNEVFIPRDIFDKILAGCLQKYKLKQNAPSSVEPSVLLRGLGCFEIEGVWNLIVSLQWNRSAITLTLYSTTEHSAYFYIGRRLLRGIKRIIDTVLQTNCHEHMQYRAHLHCSYKLGPRDDPLPVEEVIRSKSHHLCRGENCQHRHHLRRRHLSVWISGTRSAPPMGNDKHGHKPVTAVQQTGTQHNAREIIRNWRKFFRRVLRKRRKIYVVTEYCEDPDHFGIPYRMPTPREFGRLSEYVGNWYALMFAELGMKSQMIEQIRSECSQLSFCTQITKMFLKWSTLFCEHTFAHIATAMSKFGVDQDDVLRTIERPSDVHRTVKGVELPESILRRKPTEDEIRFIAEKVDKSCFNLCLELGLTVPEIDQVDMEYDKVKDRMVKLLKRWVKGCKEPATIRRILLAMERCNMDVGIIGKMCLCQK